MLLLLLLLDTTPPTKKNKTSSFLLGIRCLLISTLAKKAKSERIIESVAQSNHYLLIVPKDNLVSRPLTPPTRARRRGPGAPRCGTTLIAALNQRSTIRGPPSQPSTAMKKPPLGDPCPGKPEGQARNYWSFAATDHIWWSCTEIGRGWGGQCQPVLQPGTKSASSLHASLSLK